MKWAGFWAVYAGAAPITANTARDRTIRVIRLDDSADGSLGPSESPSESPTRMADAATALIGGTRARPPPAVVAARAEPAAAAAGARVGGWGGLVA